MEQVIPKILILSSKFDLSCDFVTARLSEQSATYLRLNSEDLTELDIVLDPINETLVIKNDSIQYLIDSSNLKSIYFRRPVYLREYGVPFSINEQHSRVQWAAFIRNLMLFDNCYWMNHPGATYVAEHKAVQLKIASKLGFNVPETSIQNIVNVESKLLDSQERVILKGLDTVLARSEDKEVFGFTHLISKSEIESSNVYAAPVTLQKFIENKIDIRVTVIDDEIFSVSIKKNGRGIDVDWRQHKENIIFEQIILPPNINKICLELLDRLKLRFGAIDLALSGGNYYFIEINPTGEWAWLVDSSDLPIDKAIANTLMGIK